MLGYIKKLLIKIQNFVLYSIEIKLIITAIKKNMFYSMFFIAIFTLKKTNRKNRKYLYINQLKISYI